MIEYKSYIKFSDIYSKQELKDNNWKTCYVLIHTYEYMPIGPISAVEKFPVDLTEAELSEKAKEAVREYFKRHPEYNPNDFTASYSYGDSRHGVTVSLSLYHILKNN